MKRQFWAVKWLEVIRISDKVETAEQACKDCYGMVATSSHGYDHEMEVIPLGGNKEAARKAIRGDLSKRTDWKKVGR